MTTAVLIPCFNEATTIGKVVRDFKAADPTVTVYVYDNNSTDETARLAENEGAIVVPEYRQGKGLVIRSMFRDIDADCYVLVDGDDTYPVDAILGMRQAVLAGKADMVVGDRLSGTYFVENKRRFHSAGNRLVRSLVNLIFRSSVHDIMSGGRCLSRRFVKSMPVTSPGFEVETEMTIHALDKRFLIHEVPIKYRDRQGDSHSKLSTFRDGFKVLGTILVLFRDYRPLLFFGVLSAVLLAVALGLFFGPLDEYITTGYVHKVPSLVVSIAAGVGALLSFATGVILDSIRTHSRQFYELTLNLLEHETRCPR